MEYLSSKTSLQKFTKSGLIVPARIDVATSKTFLDNQKPHNARIFLDVIKTSKPTPVTVNYRETLDKIKTDTEQLFNIEWKVYTDGNRVLSYFNVILLFSHYLFK